jgi:hypothetical protein
VVKPLPVSKDGHFTPPAGSKVTPLPGGRKETMTPDGTKVQANARGKATSITKPDGTQARLNPNTGRVTTVRKIGPDGSVTSIHNSPTGVRHVETVSKDSFGQTIRTVGDGHSGYRERELTRRPGFRQRTYYDHGRAYVRIYHDHPYGAYGVYPVYVPAYYYQPGFYAYFGASWGAPIAFGWSTYPGYDYYAGYFAPAQSYSTPDAWMADYIISQNLQAAYAAQQDAAADAANSGTPLDAEQQSGPVAPIPPDVRAAYVQQVQTSVQAAQAQAAGQPVQEDAPGALSPKFRFFQSYSDVEATDSNGDDCALSGGDFVRREEDTPDSTKTVAVMVVTVAKPTASHCLVNAEVRLAVDTLQDWYNSFVQSQQAGFDAMAAQQGKNGFPAAATTARVVNPDGQGTPDDPKAVSNAIQDQQSSATTIQAQATGGGE